MTKQPNLYNRIFNKHKYIKVYTFKNDKTLEVSYYKKKLFNPDYLINPNHVYNHLGYSTVIITDKATETIDPLDFTSKFKRSEFTTAINSKVIKDALASIETPKIDIVKLMLFALLGINVILLYIIVTQSGGVV